MRVRRIALRCVLAGCMAVALLLSALAWRFGSPALAAAWLRGERFVLSPAEVDLGECASRTEHVVKFTLTNLTAGPIRIVGGEQSCSCVALEELPIEVDSRGSAEISVKFFVAGRDEYSQQLILYIDDEGELKSVAARVRARIEPGDGG